MTRTTWTPECVAQLADLYPVNSTQRVAEIMGLPVRAIYHKANALCIKKSAEFLAGRESGRFIPGSGKGAGSRFVKGNQAWNKGTSYQPGGGSTGTRFKPGNISGNARRLVKPVGFERISPDGILQRKVNNDSPAQRRWQSVHSIVWEAAHGQIPHGHVVVFKHGLFTNKADEITLDKLELISRQELMRRNSYHGNYPKEIGHLIQLQGAITRQINKQKRKATA